MSRIAAPLGAAACIFAALLAALAWQAAHGYIAAPVWTSMSEAILLRDGAVPFERVVTAFPPLAALVPLAAQTLTDGTGLPAPSVAAAAIAALLAGHWAARFSGLGYTPGVPLIAALLIALHPFTLYTVACGPAAVLLLGAVYWLTTAVADLRAKARVSDMMNAGLALLVLAFTHPDGLLAAAVMLPFMALCLPPAFLARSASGAYLLLIFPAVFAIASFIFVRLTFGVSGFAFTAAYAAGPGAAGLELAASGATLSTAQELTAIAIAALLAMPVLMQAAAGGAERLPAALPVLAMTATGVLTAYVAAHRDGAEVTAALTPFIGIVPAAIASGGRMSLPGAAAVSALVMGLIGGALVVSSWGDGEPGRWRDAMSGIAMQQPADSPIAGALAAGRFLAGKNGVLADTDAAPELAAGRGSAQGLIVSGSDEFRLALLTGQITSRYAAVSAPANGSLKGQLARAFPRLYEHGLPGYRRIYSASGWRVYERTAGAR